MSMTGASVPRNTWFRTQSNRYFKADNGQIYRTTGSLVSGQEVFTLLSENVRVFDPENTNAGKVRGKYNGLVIYGGNAFNSGRLESLPDNAAVSVDPRWIQKVSPYDRAKEVYCNPKVVSNPSVSVKQKGSTMSKFAGILGSFIRLVNDRCVYDFRSGAIGVKSSIRDEFHTFVLENGRPKLSKCEVSQFGLPIPAVAMRTPIADVKPGDLVIFNDISGEESWGFFLGLTQDPATSNKEIDVIEADTGRKSSYTIQDGMLLDGNAILCVRNLAGNQSGLQSLLPFILLMDKDSSSNKDLMMAMMLGQNGQVDQNMLMMLMLMDRDNDGDEDGLSSMLPLLLMSGGLNGGAAGGMNPLMLLAMSGKLGGDGDTSSLLPLMLLGGQGGTNTLTSNPLMMMMLLGKGGDIDPMMLMLLSGGLGGGVNPFAPAPAPAPAPRPSASPVA